MSNIAIQGAATGTGVFTLASPATNTDRTLTLPDEAGTVLTSAGVPASAMPAGSVLQVVQNTYSTNVVLTSTSYADSGLSASITPTSASSKILVIASMSADAYRSSNNTLLVLQSIVRDSTRLTEKQGYFGGAQSGDGYFYSLHDTSFVYLDSPATTSSTTYKVQGALGENTSSPGLRYNLSGSKSVIILMEIAG
jgi:hypothetical protein